VPKVLYRLTLDRRNFENLVKCGFVWVDEYKGYPDHYIVRPYTVVEVSAHDIDGVVYAFSSRSKLGKVCLSLLDFGTCPLRLRGSSLWLCLREKSQVPWQRWVGCSVKDCSIPEAIEELRKKMHRRKKNEDYLEFYRLFRGTSWHGWQALYAYLEVVEGLKNETVREKIGVALARECMKDETCPYRPLAEVIVGGESSEKKKGVREG